MLNRPTFGGHIKGGGRFEDNLLYLLELSSISARLRIFCRLSLADEVQAVAEREDNSDCGERGSYGMGEKAVCVLL